MLRATTCSIATVADFSRNLFNLIYPHSVHRNAFADWGITTPKQVARSLVSYARSHPEVDLKIFVIPRFRVRFRAVTPSMAAPKGFIKSKKYVLPQSS